ncbi:hypothetical protein FACS1894153_2680 [Bacteroidia bacterium]|nr:hypothetical protein FACS1894153_2680 [Bacteroidia bacterium]
MKKIIFILALTLFVQQAYSAIQQDTIYLDTIPQKRYGDPNFKITYRIVSGRTPTITYSTQYLERIEGTDSFKIIGAAPAGSSASITLRLTVDSEWSAATRSRTFLCGKLQQLVTLDSSLTKKWYHVGDTIKNMATSNSKKPIIYTSSDTTIAKTKDSLIIMVKEGTVTIAASQTSDNNHLQIPNLNDPYNFPHLVGPFQLTFSTQSQNSKLSSLTLNDGNILLGFNPDSTTYYKRIIEDSIYISAIAQNDSAKVVGLGNKHLISGDTTFYITVTSQDNSSFTTYSLKITKTPTIAPSANKIIYVNSNASTNKAETQGASWNKATKELADAIEIARILNNKQAGSIEQIWVAKGTYKPLFQASASYYNKDMTFWMPDNIKVFGGFAGTETSTDNINPKNNETILSGDIGIIGNNTDNVYHVITCIGNMGTASLSGFSIIAGGDTTTADGSTITNGFSIPRQNGGGIVLINATYNINQVKIYDNIAINNGGAIYSYQSTYTISNSLIRNNCAKNFGGCIYDERSKISMINNTIVNNTATSGQALYFTGLTTSTFYNNVVWGNLSSITALESFDSKYNLIEGFSNTNSGNIDGTNIANAPTFNNSATYNFNPTYTSSILNKGSNSLYSSSVDAVRNSKDVEGKDRLFLKNIDMGAYEFFDANMDLRLQFLVVDGDTLNPISDNVDTAYDVFYPYKGSVKISAKTISASVVILPSGIGTKNVVTGKNTFTISVQSANGQYKQDYILNVYISATNQYIEFDDISDKTYGDDNFKLRTFCSSGLPVMFDIQTPNLIEIFNGDSVRIIGTGIAIIKAYQSGNQQYDSASSITKYFNISKCAQTLTFDSIVPKIIGDKFTPAHITSPLPITYHIQNTDIASITAQNTIFTVAKGKTIITASQSGDNNYLASDTISRVLWVKNNDTLLSELYDNCSRLSIHFSPNNFEYYENVSYDNSSITFSGTPNDTNATVDGLTTYPLTVGENNIYIVVYAEDGVHSATYLIHITRLDYVLSSDITLESLVLSPTPATFSPAFNKDSLIYNVTFADTIQYFHIAAAATSNLSTVSDTGTYYLHDGIKNYVVTVTAEDGINTRNYHLRVSRNANTNANLATLNITNGTLNPAFNKNTTSYTVNCDLNVNNFTISATSERPTSTIIGDGHYSLNSADTTVNIIVTAEDLVSQKTYSIHIVRARPLYTDATLSGLTIIGTEITPEFAPAVYNYSAIIPFGATEVNIYAVANNEFANIVGAGVQPFASQKDTFVVICYAEDASYYETYTITAIRDSKILPKLNDNIKIYPNPVSDELHIYIPNANKNAAVRIYDITGKLKGVYQIIKSEILINTSDFEVGIYFATYENNVVKFVKF